MSDADENRAGWTDGGDELARLRQIFAQSPSFSALLHGPDYRFVLANRAYRRLVGRAIGRTVREAFPEIESQGFLALLDEVFSTGKPFIGRDMEVVLRPPHGRAPETRFLDLGSMTLCGVSRSNRLGGAVRIVIGKTGVPSFEEGAECAVERTCAGLQQQMRAAFSPLHLLTFAVL